MWDGGEALQPVACVINLDGLGRPVTRQAQPEAARGTMPSEGGVGGPRQLARAQCQPGAQCHQRMVWGTYRTDATVNVTTAAPMRRSHSLRLDPVALDEPLPAPAGVWTRPVQNRHARTVIRLVRHNQAARCQGLQLGKQHQQQQPHAQVHCVRRCAHCSPCIVHSSSKAAKQRPFVLVRGQRRDLRNQPSRLRIVHPSALPSQHVAGLTWPS